ncbi:MAG: hypothetical protein Kow0063_11850 [Anaerolineae bacterium]
MSAPDSSARFSPVRLSPLPSDRARWGWQGIAPRRQVRLLPLLILAITVAVPLALLSTRMWAGLPEPVRAASPHSHTSVSTTTITIPTHVVEPALVQEFNPTYNMPYYRLDRSRYDPNLIENRTYTLIVLENDYLKLSIMPELGGRIYQAIFKPTGNNMFYQNPVLKPSPWGPPEMGWWLGAGGMEWGLPVEEHGYEWGTPWHYAINDLVDGVRVAVWDSQADDRLRAMVSITLLDDQALFHVTPSIENPTNHPVDFKFWLNAMLAPGPANAPGENLRFVMPGDQVTVHSSGDPRLPAAWQGMSWPIYNNVDWSRLGNWREWFGFFQRPQAAGDFQAVYDESYDEGAVRSYNSGIVRGAKFFGFGWGDKAIPPELYTDDDSAYVEMHGGLAPTFADTYRLEPGQRVTWNEQWYPVAGLGGLTWANMHLALHLETRPNQARLHITTSSPRPDVRVLLLRRDDGAILLDDMRDQTIPGQPYHSAWVDTSGLSASELGVLVYSGQALLGAYQYAGEPPVVTPTGSPPPGTETATPTATATPAPAWGGRILGQRPVGGWVSVVRIWVRGQYGLPVTIRSLDGSWSTVNYVGSKPEYGPDALEFAPLGPGPYIIEPQGLGVQVRVDLSPGVIAEVLFERVTPPTVTPTATASLTPGPPATGTATPTPSPTPPTGVTHTPTPTQTPSPTTTPTSGWVARELEPIPIAGWTGIVRVWVRGQYGLPVLIAAADDGWSTVNYVGSKPEYGPDALEFAPLGPGRYVITPQGLGVSATINLSPGQIAQVLFEPSGPGVPAPTPTPTLTPTSTPLPGEWRVRIPTNTPIPGAWFGVVRVSVQGQVGTLVRISSADGSWSAVNRTGTKPEYGPTFLEFAPLGAGTYIITAEGIPVSARLELAQGGLAVVLFER